MRTIEADVDLFAETRASNGQEDRSATDALERVRTEMGDPADLGDDDVRALHDRLLDRMREAGRIATAIVWDTYQLGMALEHGKEERRGNGQKGEYGRWLKRLGIAERTARDARWIYREIEDLATQNGNALPVWFESAVSVREVRRRLQQIAGDQDVSDSRPALGEDESGPADASIGGSGEIAEAHNANHDVEELGSDASNNVEEQDKDAKEEEDTEEETEDETEDEAEDTEVAPEEDTEEEEEEADGAEDDDTEDATGREVELDPLDHLEALASKLEEVLPEPLDLGELDDSNRRRYGKAIMAISEHARMLHGGFVLQWRALKEAP